LYREFDVGEVRLFSYIIILYSFIMSKQLEVEKLVLEERKVKALEKISTSLEDLVLWVEEIDKEEWGERVEWYLDLIRRKYLNDIEEKEEEDA